MWKVVDTSINIDKTTHVTVALAWASDPIIFLTKMKLIMHQLGPTSGAEYLWLR